MKLYRGLKSEEYREFTDSLIAKFNEGWKKILEIREKGNLKYPGHLNPVIVGLFKHQYLVRQYFTDDKKIADTYAQKEGGLILEIDVPIKDLLVYFILEFQNYPKRKTSFELTYIVKGVELFSHQEKWRLKISKV